MQFQEDVATLIDQAVDLLETIRHLSAPTPIVAETSIGSDIISVVWVSAQGLAHLAQKLGVPRVDKISTTTEHNIADRLSVLGRDRYGSLTKSPSGEFCLQPGFERWIAQAIHVTRPSKDSSIRVRPRSIAFARPATLPRRMFDLDLRRRLGSWALEKRYPNEKRYTHYVDLDRVSLAQELVVGLDPRRDGDRLLEIVEEILSDHKRGGRAPRPAGRRTRK